MHYTHLLNVSPSINAQFYVVKTKSAGYTPRFRVNDKQTTICINSNLNRKHNIRKESLILIYVSKLYFFDNLT